MTMQPVPRHRLSEAAEFLTARQLHQQGRLAQAARIYQSILQKNSKHVDTLNLYGVLLHQMKNFILAEKILQRASILKPSFPPVHTNLGNLLTDMKRYSEALTAFSRTIRLEPNNARAYSNLGVVFERLNRPDKALRNYDRAIELDPDYAEFYLNKSLTLLLWGELKEGWKLYEWRWKTKAQKIFPREFSQPLWLGEEAIKEKTILLHSEQGLGDTLQFCRYTALVKARGARVLLQVQKPLVRLLGELEGVDAILTQEDELPNFDCHCPLLSLPLAFQTDIQSIPSVYRYVDADKILQEKWASRLGSKTKPRIGITWSGNSAHINDHNRSLPLAQLINYLPKNYEYFCLQKDIRDQDLDVLGGSNIRRFSDKITDFAETAALCDLMDLVISVDTSVAHLAGALGKPTLVLLPYVPDWRWLLDREDSLWYSSVRLFRQERAGYWDPVLEKVKYALDTLFARERAY